MILINKKEKKAVISFIFIALFIGVVFLVNKGGDDPDASSVDILNGEIVYVDKSNEFMKVLADHPDEFDGAEFLVKTKSETEYGAVPGVASLSQLKDDGYAIISFSEFQEGDPVEVIIDAGDGSDLVAKRINLESEINIEHVQGAQYGTSDLGGRILEKVEDGLIIEAGVPSEVLSEVTKIKTTPKTKYRKFTPLEGVFGDDFTDEDLIAINKEDIKVGDIITNYSELIRVAPNVRNGNHTIVNTVRHCSYCEWWPNDVGFWADNYFGEVVNVDREEKRVVLEIVYSVHYAGDDIVLDMRDAEIFEFNGISDEFRSFFEGDNQDKISEVDFINVEKGDFVNAYIGSKRHTSDYWDDSIIPVKEITIGPSF